MRIDKWLWFARFFKSRSLAQAVVLAGQVWRNGQKVTKPAQEVAPGDELVFPTGPKWRRVTVLAVGERRGPAPEAQALYREASPPDPLEDEP